jgi:hypothetical protein
MVGSSVDPQVLRIFFVFTNFYLLSCFPVSQHPDMKKFRKHCEVQIELLDAIINKTMYSILLEQEQLLTQLHFPFFTNNFIQQLTSRLNQRKTFLQNRNFQELNNKFFFETSTNQDLLYQQKVICSLLSIRLSVVQQNRYKSLSSQRNNFTPMTTVQQQQQQVQQSQALPMDVIPVTMVNEPVIEEPQPLFEGEGMYGPASNDPENQSRQFSDDASVYSSEQSHDGSGGGGAGRRRRKRRRPSRGNIRSDGTFGSYDENFSHPQSYSSPGGDGDYYEGNQGDFVASSDYPLLTRQYSNTYSEASIDDYTQSVYQQDVMLNNILMNYDEQNDNDYASNDSQLVMPMMTEANGDSLYSGIPPNSEVSSNNDEDDSVLFQELKQIIQK